MAKTTTIAIDPAQAGEAFPRIHEGRYEVDLEATGLRSPVSAGLAQAVKESGLKFIRMGLGCWLPSQDPHPSVLHEREWFTGTTLEDTANPDLYNFTHLDRMLDICKELDLELLFICDHMPASLARPGDQIDTPLFLKPFAHTATRSRMASATRRRRTPRSTRRPA